MELLFCATVEKGYGEQLRQVIEKLVPKEEIQVYRTIGSLSTRLRQPRHDISLAIILAASRKDLKEALSIRNLLDGVRTILVAPDGEDETLAMAHRLRPRFLSYINGDLAGLTAVLNKMFQDYEGYDSIPKY